MHNFFKTRRDGIRNERIREEMNQESVTVRLEEKQLKLFGHITRMNEEWKPRQIWEVKVEGRRPRGRPRNTWEERIEGMACVRGKTLREFKAMASDGNRCKEFLKAFPTLWWQEGVAKEEDEEEEEEEDALLFQFHNQYYKYLETV